MVLTEQNAMKGYRDAFHPPPARTPSPPILGNGDGMLTPPPEDDGDVPEDVASVQGAASRSQPLFDEVDLDEMAAMEEMEREAAAGARRAASTDGSEPPLLQEEDEWEGLYD